LACPQHRHHGEMQEFRLQGMEMTWTRNHISNLHEISDP
jgi:hypothetical protein